MPPFNWPRRPEPIVPPAESRDLAAIEVEVRALDDRLTALVAIPRHQRHGTWMKQVNDLLDERYAVRPARPKPRPSVPVIPGRSS